MSAYPLEMFMDFKNSWLWLTSSRTSAILIKVSSGKLIKVGTDFKNEECSACRIRPVLIIIVWKHWRSIAQSLQSTAALMVAVRLQLYKMASSPKTFPGGIILRNLPSLETSTFPSEKERMVLLQIKERVPGSNPVTGGNIFENFHVHPRGALLRNSVLDQKIY